MRWAIALLLASVQVKSAAELPTCSRSRNGMFIQLEGEETIYWCDATLGMWLKIEPKKKEKSQ